MKQKFLLVILLIILSLPSVFGLIHKGFFQSDDGEWMVIRFSAFHQAFRDGQFPVRFLPRLNFDYGYPVANFLYPGFMYLGEPIHLLGFGFVNTIKIIFGLSMIFSCVFTFFWLNKLFGKFEALIGAFFYVYVPYHIYDLYQRGSIGEILALSIIPFILWQVERRSLLWSAAGIGMLILSHNSLALIFLPIIIGYIFLKHKISSLFLLAILLGIGISTFFWFPAIYDLQYTIFSQVKISDISQYYSSVVLIGFPLIVFLVELGVLVFKKPLVKKKEYFLVCYFIALGIMSIYISSRLSAFFWKLLPISFIQFPFRFLSIELLSTAFIIAFFLRVIPVRKTKIITGILLSVILFISSYQYLTPKVFFDKGEGFYATNEDSTTVKNEYMPKWVKTYPLVHPQNSVEVQNGVISDISKRSNKISFTVFPKEKAKVLVNTIYFPGWFVTKEGLILENYLVANDKGIISFDVPTNTKNQKVEYKLEFKETNIRFISDCISLASLAILLIISLKLRVSKA